MSAQPVENLQLRAIEQRNNLHQTTVELKRKISATREQFDIKRNVRDHFAGIAAVVTAVALLSGYGIGMKLMQR
jgi:hypothetical protein